MNTKLVNTAAGVLAASMEQGKTLPATLAIALDSAQLLQSPETAAEHERVRTKYLEAADTVARLVLERGQRMKVENALRDEIVELQQQRDRRRVRLIAAEADLLSVRGLLSANGEPRRVPANIEIHERVAPAVEWLLNRVAELERQLAAKDRPVDEDPICFALTEKADGITRRLAPTQALRAEAGEPA